MKVFYVLLIALLLLIPVTFQSSNATTSGPIYQVPITVTNNQNVSTPNPFQQMLILNESNYKGYIVYNGSFANFEFTYVNGTVIPAWIESNSSGKLTIWLKLVSIRALSSLTIYLDIFSLSTNLLNASGKNGIGEAPQLSKIYGEYDNGANVFIQYGGGGSTGWSKFTYIDGTWTTANGYLQQTETSGSNTGGYAALIESTRYPNNGYYILGMAFNYTGQASPRVGIIAVASLNSTYGVVGYRFIGQQISGGAGFISFLNDNVAWVVNNIYQGAVSTPYTMIITNAGGTWSGNLYSGYGTETSNPLTSLSPTSYTAANYAGATSGYVGISAATASGPNPINVMWFYMRAYLPNGVMPLVTFGAIYPLSHVKINMHIQIYSLNLSLPEIWGIYGYFNYSLNGLNYSIPISNITNNYYLILNISYTVSFFENTTLYYYISLYAYKLQDYIALNHLNYKGKINLLTTQKEYNLTLNQSTIQFQNVNNFYYFWNQYGYKITGSILIIGLFLFFISRLRRIR